MPDAVTPQMYGAVGDGRTDDTAAFQAAVDSGYDVYIPTANRETYLIKNTIIIKNPNCKRIFSEPIYRLGGSGFIRVDFRESETPKTIAVFELHTQLLRITGLRFSSVADEHRVGVFLNAMDESICDYDVRIEHCSLSNFYRVVRFTGRGLEILNSNISSCQYLADLYWNDENDTNNNHPAKYDQRAICVKNCRLHNIASAFFIFRSGHAYGFHFQGNTVDNGKGYLIRAYEQAYGWNISGNVIQGIKGDFDFMTFRKGMKNCVITGNTFLSDVGYWSGTSSTVKSWLKCSGAVSSSIISNNAFKNSDGGFMIFKDITGSSIFGNAMQNDVSNATPAITIIGACSKNAFVANTFSVDSAPMFSKKIPSGNAVVGNIPDA